LLDRALEALPSDQELQERTRAGRGLTRPELAVLLSYAKIALQHDLLESAVPEEPQLESWLTGYFPPLLRERFGGDIAKHSLRREIVALGLTNAIVNRGGPAMPARLVSETQRTSAEVAHAFLATREVFDLPALWLRIDALDGGVKGDAQLDIYQATRDLVNAQTLWFLRNSAVAADLAGTIARHREGLAGLRAGLAQVLPDRRKIELERKAEELAAAGIPGDVGSDIAALDVLGLAPPITEIAEETGAPMTEAARAYLAIGEYLRLSDLAASAGSIATPDTYDRLAVAQARNQLEAAQAAFTRAVLRGKGDAQAWLAEQGDRLQRIKATLEEVAGDAVLTVSRLLVAAGLLSDLAAGLGGPSPSASTGRAAGRSRSAAMRTPPARRPAPRPRS
jgi:glutamate dehydrogenase